MCWAIPNTRLIKKPGGSEHLNVWVFRQPMIESMKAITMPSVISLSEATAVLRDVLTFPRPPILRSTVNTPAARLSLVSRHPWAVRATPLQGKPDHPPWVLGPCPAVGLAAGQVAPTASQRPHTRRAGRG